MERAPKKDIEDSYKDTILKRLAETHHFDLPGTLVERELSAMVRQQLQSRQRKPGDGATAPSCRAILTTPNSSRRNIVPRQSGE